MVEKPVRIKILDHEYLLKSEIPDEDINKIACLVNDKCCEIKENVHGISDLKTAILAIFDITREYFEVLQKHDNLKEDIERRTSKVIDKIDKINDIKTKFNKC